jgi:hypothetical protein
MKALAYVDGMNSTYALPFNVMFLGSTTASNYVLTVDAAGEVKVMTTSGAGSRDWRVAYLDNSILFVGIDGGGAFVVNGLHITDNAATNQVHNYQSLSDSDASANEVFWADGQLYAVVGCCFTNAASPTRVYRFDAKSKSFVPHQAISLPSRVTGLKTITHESGVWVAIGTLI